jgi:uncharacterized protein
MMSLVHPCEAVVGSVRPWLGAILNECISTGISKDYLVRKEIDHFCFRCKSNDEYIDVRSRLTSNQIGSLLVEDMIGGRPISTILLSKPYVYETWEIPCIEVTCPKPGIVHKAGLEHIEVTIGGEEDGFLQSKEKLLQFVAQHPSIDFDLKAIDKTINADVSVSLGICGSIKFHVRSLKDVCTYETAGVFGSKLPPDYFTTAENTLIPK